VNLAGKRKAPLKLNRFSFKKDKNEIEKKKRVLKEKCFTLKEELRKGIALLKLIRDMILIRERLLEFSKQQVSFS